LEGGADVKIVALTASVFNEERLSIMAAGMDDFMQKPFEFGAIYACLEEQLSIRFVRDVQNTCPGDEQNAGPDLKVLRTVNRQQCRNLIEALENLDQVRVQSEISRIAAVEPALAETLALMAGELRYTALIQVLKASEHEDA
jgi:CheY-like chemotaxis protein